MQVISPGVSKDTGKLNILRILPIIWPLAAIVGGAAGAAALVVILVILIWFCIFRSRSVSRTSETGSSDPSYQVGKSSVELSFREAKRFSWEELAGATRNFVDQSLIGEGKFGAVYKGLLKDGMLVAVKKRSAAPTQEFVEEVRYLSSIQHRNIVALMGYCQENNQQILVYEYIPNGSVSIHLYGPSSSSREKLEFKHRLAIALGAAKGLAHLHSISPRLLHKDFKTSNVLVDENFIAKVADAGIRNFLGRFDVAGPSSQQEADAIFLAPEVKEFRQFSERSDVYSFGVFLLELVCGQEATESYSPESDQNLVEWVQNYHDFSSISSMVDKKLGNKFTIEGMEEFVQLIMRCIDASSELRPPMSYVVSELDRILEKEMNLTTGMGEGTPTVTLGSQLFRSLK
ncbi:proline-rich receptor-like protein kinase PERK8 isoform X1 [Silene latifolia]|uniref:proline-rich receptor-like protein kinase PERK8 isoform X1 n=1 Tax=Silene latifolia TaxID=37657 RepID=UPI003D779774